VLKKHPLGVFHRCKQLPTNKRISTVPTVYRIAVHLTLNYFPKSFENWSEIAFFEVWMNWSYVHSAKQGVSNNLKQQILDIHAKMVKPQLPVIMLCLLSQLINNGLGLSYIAWPSNFDGATWSM